MSQRWFVSRGEHVHGPWTTEDVRAHRRDGNISDRDVIWGLGDSVWVSLAQWNPERRAQAPAKPAPVASPIVPKTAPVIAAPPVQPAPAVKASEEETFVGTVEEVTVIAPARRVKEAWHYAIDGKSHGPFERAALINELRRLPVAADASIWTNGMKEWAPVFEFHDIARELGANLREHARATISGRAKLMYDGLNHLAPLVSIGEGGLGVAIESGLFAGQSMVLEIESDAFEKPLVVTADVRYCSNGICGLRFVDLDSAARGSIARYVKQHAARDVKAA